jgi:hypothetical protein
MTIGLLAVLVFFVARSTVSAQIINGRLIGSIYTWEKFDSVDVSKKLVRGFQSALFDVTQGNFSLHTHVQVASLLQRKLDEVPDYRLPYLYIRYKNIADAADLSFGRMPYFVGVGVGTLDGALTTLRLFENKFRFTAYGGANVPLDLALQDWGPIKNNFVLGGQVLVSAVENTRLGASYVNRQRQRPGYWTSRADSLFNPTSVYVDPLLAKEQYVSGDASWGISDLNAHGRYDYDLNGKKSQRAQLGVRCYPTNDWVISADYIYRAPRVLYNSFFSVFNTSTINEFEGGVDYRVDPCLRAFVRGAYVKYEDDNSFRYTVGLAHDYASLSYRGNTGYAGELSTITAQGSYPFCDKMVIPTAGLTYASYRLNDKADRQNAVATVLGIILRPIQTLSVDFQGQWLNNKVAKSDFRLFGEVNFWFSERMNIFD